MSDKIKPLFFPAVEDYSDLYTYDLKIPMERADEVYALFRADLERQFGIIGWIELQERSCWILRAADSTKFISSGGKPVEPGGHHQNMDIVTLLEYFNQPFDKQFQKLYHFVEFVTGLPLINEVRYNGLVNFRIEEEAIKTKNFEYLRSAYMQNGFSLTKGMRQVPVLVLREKKAEVPANSRFQLP